MAILAARQIDRVGNVPSQLRRDWALADYLATEVLASLPEELRDFVLDSCLDEQVCPSLLDSIRERPPPETLLEQCLSDGIFLSRGTAATDEPWFSWHPLFASHVQRRVSSDRPARAAELHAAAAAWWVSVDVPTAIEHAAAASDEMAARIFSEHWLQLFLEGRVDAVMGAIEHHPHALTAHGDAHLAKALVLVRRGRFDAARAEVAAAHEAAAALRDEASERLEERTAVVELLLMGYDKGLGVAVETGEAMLAQLARAERVPDPTITASLQVVVGMGEARLQSHLELALHMLRASAATAHDNGLVALELTALAESCLPAIAEGRLTEVHDVAVDVLERAAERGWVGLVTLAPAVAYLGWLDYWRGNLTQARSQLEQSLSMVLPFDRELRGLTLNFHVKTCLALGDARAARASITAIRAMSGSGTVPPWWPSMLDGLEGLALIAEGKPREAAALASSAPAEPEYGLAQAHRAKVLLVAGDPAAALAELDRVPISTTFVHITCLSRCIEAEARATLGRADAHASLEHALAAAEPDQLYGPFMRRGQTDGGPAPGPPAPRDRPPRRTHSGALAPLEAARAPRSWVERAPHRPRTRDPAVPRDHPHQRRDRRGRVHLAAHRQDARGAHLPEARRQQPPRRHPPGDRAGALLRTRRHRPICPARDRLGFEVLMDTDSERATPRSAPGHLHARETAGQGPLLLDLSTELARGLEPLTACLQDRCATNCATPARPGASAADGRKRNRAQRHTCKPTGLGRASRRRRARRPGTRERPRATQGLVARGRPAQLYQKLTEDAASDPRRSGSGW